MVEYLSAAKLRANGISVAASFSSQIYDALTLEELTAKFREAVHIEGACRHSCFAIEDGRRHFLFGDDDTVQQTAQSASCLIIFPITGWDEMAYEVEIAVTPGFMSSQGRASLHAMATLYLCRSLALLDAEDDLATAELTAIERFSHKARSRGSCDLDIADVLDRSVHAVAVHLQRADRKLGC